MKLKIKEYRDEAGMTQKELAKKISNVQRNVSNWESGVSEPDCETILQLCEVFEISVDELFGRVGVTPRKKEPLDMRLEEQIRRLSREEKEALLFLLQKRN